MKIHLVNKKLFILGPVEDDFPMYAQHILALRRVGFEIKETWVHMHSFN